MKDSLKFHRWWHRIPCHIVCYRIAAQQCPQDVFLMKWRDTCGELRDVRLVCWDNMLLYSDYIEINYALSRNQRQSEFAAMEW